MRWQLWRGQGGLLTSPSFVPLALFTSLTLSLLMLATIWSCEQENAATLRHEAAALQAAIRTERDDFVSRAAQVARTKPRADATTAAEDEAFTPVSSFAHIFVVDLSTGAARADD